MPSFAALSARITIGSLLARPTGSLREIAMSKPSFEIPPARMATERRLDSWKEIAAYLNRDVTTVQRWEKRKECRSIGICTTGAAPSTL